MSDTPNGEPTIDPRDLQARVQELTAENERLRAELEAVRQQRAADKVALDALIMEGLPATDEEWEILKAQSVPMDTFLRDIEREMKRPA
jgi:hypothetical protein